MTTDFKATQVQTNKIIVTGSFAGDGSNQLLIYNYAADDSGSPNQGQIDPTKFDTTSGIGSDVFLFVSGGVATRGTGGSYGVTVIGGDLHVSGNLTVDGTSPGGGGGGGGNEYWESTVAGEIFATGSLVAVAGSVWASFLSASNGLEITGSFTHGTNTSASSTNSHAQGDSTTASGNYSHAEGSGTTASASGAHSEGVLTDASAQGSHSEGYSTTASGNYSHAEGDGTTASGDYSHAEGASGGGGSLIASGYASHAEGYNTIASGEASHSEGDYTTASGSYSHAEGTYTIADGLSSHAEGWGSATHLRGFTVVYVDSDGVDPANGIFQLDSVYGDITADIQNAANFTSLMVTDGDIAGGFIGDRRVYDFVGTNFESSNTWITCSNPYGMNPQAPSPYTGSIIASFAPLEWQLSNLTTPPDQAITGTISHAEGIESISIGSGSHAEGFRTLAIGVSKNLTSNSPGAATWGAHAEGLETIAYGNYSHSEGNSTTASGGASHAEGDSTIASGDYSHAEGVYTTASGDASHAEGDSTTASGYASHAEGDDATASGDFSHAEGKSTTASGEYSHSEGSSTTASGNYSHAEGGSSTSTGQYSHAEGGGTFSIGEGSHAEGDGTTASGQYSHAEGKQTVTSGSYSHAEGLQAIASGSYTHAEGGYTVAVGEYSHAEGIGTFAMGDASHAEGFATLAEGIISHAEGYYTTGSGLFSHAEGSGSIAFGVASHAEGLFTIASGSGQLAAGKFNLRNNDFSLFVIGDGTADDDANRSDIVRVNSGTLPGSGSFEVTGTIHSTLGFSGSLTQLTDGTPYLIAGTGIQTSTGSNGAVTISTAGGGGSGDQYWQSTVFNNIFTTGSAQALYLSSSTGGEVTGTLSVKGSIVTNGGTTVDGGTTVGQVFEDTDSAGASYGLVIKNSGAGFGIPFLSFVQGSTVASGFAGGIGGWTKSPAFGYLPGLNLSFYSAHPRIAIRNAITSTNMASFNADGLQVTGTVATDIVHAASGITGSLTKLANGTPYLIAGTNVQISTGSTGAVTISSIPNNIVQDRTTATNFTIDTATDQFIRVSAAATGTLPNPATSGSFVIKKTGTGTYTINVSGSYGETIDGQSYSSDGFTLSGSFATDRPAWTMWSDGTNWWIA